MLKEGGEADDNGSEEPIEIVRQMKGDAVEVKIETWIEGPGIIIIIIIIIGLFSM